MVSLENFSIVGREEQNLSRLIKESMFIGVNSPSLTKNIGKYHMPQIWDEVPINNCCIMPCQCKDKIHQYHDRIQLIAIPMQSLN